MCVWQLVYVIVSSLAAAEAGVDGQVMILEDEPLSTLPAGKPTVPGKLISRAIKFRLNSENTCCNRLYTRFLLVYEQEFTRRFCVWQHNKLDYTHPNNAEVNKQSGNRQCYLQLQQTLCRIIL